MNIVCMIVCTDNHTDCRTIGMHIGKCVVDGERDLSIREINDDVGTKSMDSVQYMNTDDRVCVYTSNIYDSRLYSMMYHMTNVCVYVLDIDDIIDIDSIYIDMYIVCIVMYNSRYTHDDINRIVCSKIHSSIDIGIYILSCGIYTNEYSNTIGDIYDRINSMDRIHTSYDMYDIIYK